MSANSLLAIDTSDTGGVLVPLVIIAACLVIILIAVIARRRKLRRGAALDGPGDGLSETSAATGAGDWHEAPTDLGEWQTTHGHSVDRWLDAHEGSLPTLAPGADPEIDAELDQAMANAAAVCPNPDVSRMLAGMHKTARATRIAIADSDRPAAEAAHEQYGRHRAAAIDALQRTPETEAEA